MCTAVAHHACPASTQRIALVLDQALRLQVIDDTKGHTMVAASTMQNPVKSQLAEQQAKGSTKVQSCS